MSHVFISYVRENQKEVDRLHDDLARHGVEVWLDRKDIAVGVRWRQAIRRAIRDGAFFIACFSKEYSTRSITYMNEELTLAIDILRQRPIDQSWFLPVKLSECDIPDRDIGAGETLEALQYVELHKDWDAGIQSILDVIQPDSSIEPQIDVPVLEEKDWQIILRRIKDGRCTPFLGFGACYGVLPYESEIAREWADEYRYPMADSIDIAKVAQFLAVTYDSIFPKERLAKRLQNAAPPDFSEPDEPHGVLAALPFPVYITTNYDDFLIQALKAKHKEPKREICRWSKWLQDMPSVFDNSNYVPTVSNPVVFHFYGHFERPASMVFMEDDYLDLLANISSNPNLLPPRIRDSLASTCPLFLGYNLSDERFRKLFHILSPWLQADPSYPRLMMDKYTRRSIVAARTETTEEQQQYLEEYFDQILPGQSKRIFHKGTFKEFMAQLRQRWEKFSDEYQKDMQRRS